MIDLDDVQVGEAIYHRSVGNQGNVITFDACDRNDVKMDVVETILGWFDNWKGVHVLIEPYMAEYSLIVRVGWPCGQCGFVRVDGAVDPPVFIKWVKGLDDAIFDFTPYDFWRAFTIEWGGDDYGNFGGLCPLGPRQFMERKILESDFTLTNQKYSFDELRSICQNLQPSRLQRLTKWVRHSLKACKS